MEADLASAERDMDVESLFATILKDDSELGSLRLLQSQSLVTFVEQGQR